MSGEQGVLEPRQLFLTPDESGGDHLVDHTAIVSLL